MRTWISLAAVCAALFLAVAPASARTVEETTPGGPTIELTIPDTWTAQQDNDGNLILNLPGGRIAFSVTVMADDRELDVSMAEVFSYIQASAQRVDAAELSGMQGALYRGSFVHPEGFTLNFETAAVKADQNWVAAVTIVSLPGATQSEQDAAYAIRDSARIRW